MTTIDFAATDESPSWLDTLQELDPKVCIVYLNENE
jgi:hypothetical protein